MDRLRDALRPRPSQAAAAHREEILAALARYRMSDVRIFGSAARGTDEPGSDLDLLVALPADADLLDLIDGAEAVEEIVGVHVDIVSARALRPDHEIARTARPL